ncbi:hypothetical protein Tco_1446433 [Tanacetum coccineum]
MSLQRSDQSGSYIGLGSGPARASCAFSGSDLAWPYVLTGMLTHDVTVDESTSPCSLLPLGAAASVSLSIRSESDMDEDSWIHFSMMNHFTGLEEASSCRIMRNKLLVLSIISGLYPCLLLLAVCGVVSDMDPDHYSSK